MPRLYISEHTAGSISGGQVVAWPPRAESWRLDCRNRNCVTAD